LLGICELPSLTLDKSDGVVSVARQDLFRFSVGPSDCNNDAAPVRSAVWRGRGTAESIAQQQFSATSSNESFTARTARDYLFAQIQCCHYQYIFCVESLFHM
jgi:hypothetical protein